MSLGVFVPALVVLVLFLVIIVAGRKEVREGEIEDKAWSKLAGELGCAFTFRNLKIEKELGLPTYNVTTSRSVSTVMTFMKGCVEENIFEESTINEYLKENIEYRIEHQGLAESSIGYRISDSEKKFPSFQMEYNEGAQRYRSNPFYFESYQKFNKDFFVETEHENAVHELFTDEVLELLSQNLSPLRMEVQGGALYIFRGSKVLNPDKESFMKVYNDFHSLGIAFKKALEESVSIQE